MQSVVFFLDQYNEMEIIIFFKIFMFLFKILKFIKIILKIYSAKEYLSDLVLKYIFVNFSIHLD